VGGYRERRPAPTLAHAVECYWFRTGRADGGAGLANRILPDGCMDIIVNLGDPIAGDGAPNGHVAFVVGAMTTARLALLQGRMDTVGIRFRPGMAPAFLREDADRLTDGVADLAALWKPAAVRSLVEHLANHATDPDRSAVLDEALEPLRQDASGDGVDAAIRAVHDTRGAVDVAHLARLAGMSTRQFERRFPRRVGLSPKLAARIARFGLAAGMLREQPSWTGARVAATAGYHDQPHMVRDFHAFAGLTPTQYLAERVASVQEAAGAAV
jgi:methylphosphotriester-DNA--protein-cysteine methyltransferase